VARGGFGYVSVWGTRRSLRVEVLRQGSDDARLCRFELRQKRAELARREPAELLAPQPRDLLAPQPRDLPFDSSQPQPRDLLAPRLQGEQPRDPPAARLRAGASKSLILPTVSFGEIPFLQ